jgi:hypothetical protein
MKKIIITLSAFLFLSFAHTAVAATAAGTLVIEGRSIPENSIAVESSVSGSVGQAFVLDATKSQDDGVVRTYSWTQVAGPIVKFSGQSGENLSFTPTVAGTYVFDLVATDATGLTSVVKKSQFIVDGAPPSVKTTPPPPPPSPSGDPDFDLLQVAPSPVSVSDMNRDGVVDVVTKTAPPPPPPSSSGLRGSDSGVSELSDTRAQTIPTVTNEGRDRAPETSVALDGSISGDPDFDMLNISVGGDDLEKFRAEVSSGNETNKVTVRGWDPKKKEEIIGRPEEVKTSDDLKMYVEAVALNDEAIKDIRINKDVIEVESRESGKLFGFIPVHMTRTVSVKYSLADSSEDPVDVEFSWWHVFVKKPESASDITKEIKTELYLLKMEDMKRVRSESAISSHARTLQLLSNVLKTKHDTAKNSISNVR